jgi:hypothetical protein
MKQQTSTKKRVMEKTTKKARAPKKDVFNDLCTTCTYSSDCVNATDDKRPIHQCEEFDSYTPPVAEPEIKAQPVEAKVDNMKYTGICINCDHRESCAQSATEGGIWQCEEYS